MRIVHLLFGFIAFAGGFAPVKAEGTTVPYSYDNALTCALLYAHFGDEGPAFNRLVTIAADLGKQTPDAIRADIASRRPILRDAYANGQLDEAEAFPLTQDACPNSFSVTAAKRAPTSAAKNLPDAVQCAGLFRFFDRQFPSNAWGTTWAGDEMARRGARATGMGMDAFNTKAHYAETGFENRYARQKGAGIAAMLDEAADCQSAYDTVVPPGAVLAAAEFGDRPGILRGRNDYCQALSNDFFREYPDLNAMENALWTNPILAMESLEKTTGQLKWYADAMIKAECSAAYLEPINDAMNTLTDRLNATAEAVLAKARRDGPWWN